MTILQTDNLTTGYGRTHPVSKHLNLTLYAGELVTLIGPNGAGKSTLMQTLAGMLKPIEGRVLLHGQDVYHMPSLWLARHLGIVLTERPDVGLLTGRGLVALGRHPHTDWTGALSTHDEAMVEWALEAVRATAFAHKPVAQLSDGQRQKVMIGRALAQEGDVILLDEPTAFLDLPRRVEVMRLLRTLARETGRAILLSTHDLDLALRTADRMWLLSEGGSIEVGIPEHLVLNGAFERVFAGFDRDTGSFKTTEETQGTVNVRGEGSARIWTERALQREGYIVTDDNPTLRIEVQTEGWRMDDDTFFTLEALLAAVRREKF